MKIKKIDNNSLRLIYSILNKLLFSSRLPRVLVALGRIKDPDTRGYYMYDKGSKKPLAIVIDSRDKDPIRVLVHEMCHVYWNSVLKRDGDHPPGFIRILRSKYKKLGLRLDPYEVREGA